MMSKIALITRVLDHFYPSPPIPLNHFDNFTLLVSVVLSAQTTDGKVNEVTKTLFEVAPSPQLMSAMSAAEIQKIIQPVGLAPKKSVYLKSLSQMIIDNFNGEVPSTYENLESLPGVGHKTASVVMSQAFGESALAVDTHVHRLSLRWGLSADEKNVDKVQLDLHRQFPQEHWNKIHLQMIYFGREYCTAKLHVSKECPMCSWVNKKDGQPAVSFTDFTPKKKSKGIVFYEERMVELKESPHLARGAVLLTDSDTKSYPPGDSILFPAVKMKGRQTKEKMSAVVSEVKIKDEVKVKKEVGSVVKTPSRKRVKPEVTISTDTDAATALDFSSPVAVKRQRTPRKVKNLVLEPKNMDLGSRDPSISDAVDESVGSISVNGVPNQTTSSNAILIDVEIKLEGIQGVKTEFESNSADLLLVQSDLTPMQCDADVNHAISVVASTGAPSTDHQTRNIEVVSEVEDKHNISNVVTPSAKDSARKMVSRNLEISSMTTRSRRKGIPSVE